MSTGIIGAAHTGITVLDLERSLSFWRDVLGFEVAMRDRVAGDVLEQITGVPEGDMTFVILNAPGGYQIELLHYSQPADRAHLRPRPSDVGSVHIAFFVEDIHALLRQVAASGWHAVGEPQTRTSGVAKGTTFVYMQDPDGTIVELIQLAAEV